MNEACDYAQELMPWLVNGTLASAETVAVLDHVRSCAYCRGELAFLVAAKTATALAWSAEPDPLLSSALWAQIETKFPEQEGSSDRQRSRFAVAAEMIVRGMAPLSFVYDALDLAYRPVAGNVREMLAVIR